MLGIIVPASLPRPLFQLGSSSPLLRGFHGFAPVGLSLEPLNDLGGAHRAPARDPPFSRASPPGRGLPNGPPWPPPIVRSRLEGELGTRSTSRNLEMKCSLPPRCRVHICTAVGRGSHSLNQIESGLLPRLRNHDRHAGYGQPGFAGDPSSQAYEWCSVGPPVPPPMTGLFSIRSANSSVRLNYLISYDITRGMRTL